MKVIGNIYEITREVHKALSTPTYTGRTMTNENDILSRNIFIRDLGYTGYGDRDSKRKTFFTNKLPKLAEETQNKIFDEINDDSADLQGQGVKIIIPSKVIDIYTRLDFLQGLKLSGHTDTFAEASNLIDELYQRGEIQNNQQYRNALSNFSK